MKVINVAKNFSKFPSGRYKKNGNTSGEEFRDDFLIPALKKGKPFIVELDGTIGYGSSFLEEAFGGLIRETDLSSKDIFNLIRLDTKDEALKLEIASYLDEASNRKSK